MVARRLHADEIDVFKSLRLAALATDPDAFSSDYERESAFPDEEWTRRLASFGERRGCVVVDVVDGQPIGMTGVGDDVGDVMLWGMWVAPNARGTGVGRRLIEAAATWATSIDAATLSLWVMRSNADAIALYRRTGFESVDVGAPPAPPSCADEQFMRRPL